MTTKQILKINEERHLENSATFNPITGEGSIGSRSLFVCDGFPLRVQYLPNTMMETDLVRLLRRYRSLDEFIEKELEEEVTNETRELVVEQFCRLRDVHDFAFWAARLVYIKRKGGGDDMLFTLNRPQRKLVGQLERMRVADKPIRLILLKARQWGGSTCIQIYMAWLQLVHEVGLNSLIVGHLKSASTEVKSMFERLINQYPLERLYELGAEYETKAPKLVGVGTEQNIKRIPQRNCNIKVGTAESPDSARGGDYNLVHCTEVGLWKKTEGKTPEDIIRSACSGVVLRALTMIIYESTANGSGNFFHREYIAAKSGESQFEALFIAWYEIEMYSLPFDTEVDRRKFAEQLYRNRHATESQSNRAEPGQYLWWLWERGATLENIHWYVTERRKYNDHGDMASEYPSDDVEAFVHSGDMVFDKYQVEDLRAACRPPRHKGELQGKSCTGPEALEDIKFVPEEHGALSIWFHPEIYEDERILNRYLVVVDIGGRSKKSDYSVIVVFDRIHMMDGGKPSVVAQWYGHIDMDILAWKAAQIARYYDNALLVIESNTLETHDKDRRIDGGDHSTYILSEIKDHYDNLYAREQSPEDIEEGKPRKYGFHTNVSTKPVIIGMLTRVLRDRLYVERDERCLDEYLCYETKPNGSMGAKSGHHDDLLMTRAIGMHICFSKMDLPREVKIQKVHSKRGKQGGMAKF